MFPYHNHKLRYLLVLLLFLSIVDCDVLFKHDTVPCLATQQEYRCIVNGTDPVLYSARWRLFDADNMVIDGSAVTYNSDTSGSRQTIDHFTFDHLELSPILTNVSFRADLSINGYSIECALLGSSDIEKFTINIPDIPDSPSNVTIHNDTFTSTSVNISWTESSSSCVTRYRYIVTHDSLPSNDTIVVESSASVPNLTASDEQYCVVVTAIDTADRNSSESDPPSCFVFKAPRSVDNLTLANETESDNYVKVVVQWDEAPFYVLNDDVIVPKLEYRVSIVDTTDTSNYSNTSDPLQSGTTEYIFNEVPKGRTYTVTVTAINGVGNSSTVGNITVSGLFIIPVTTTSTIAIPSMSATGTNTGTSSPALSTSLIIIPTSPSIPTIGSSTSFPTEAIIGIVVVAVVLILVVIIVVLVVVWLISRKKSDSIDFNSTKQGTDPIPLTENKRPQPETGQPALYQDPNTIEREKAPTGELYALPEKGSKQRRPPPAGPKNELPTYQDPNTIQRQMAPSGDMYAMPEKSKQTHAVGGMYAELDHIGPTSPTQQPLLHEMRPQPRQPVVYSSVVHN